ncbi:hypothetical protein MMC27_002828 [Xylographa pallens]|nr:hypothetical protein [Xylographa pallens]
MPPLPTPPFHPLPSIHNLRSIGTHPTSHPSLRTRSTYVYRSASPSTLTPTDLHTLSSTLHITHVFDLRSAPEIAALLPLPPFPATPAIQRIWVPVFAAQDYSPERIAVRYKEYASGRVEGFVRAYADILAEGKESFRRVLKWVREGEGVGLVHCTAGKDRYVGVDSRDDGFWRMGWRAVVTEADACRTGVLVMLLLGLVGVTDEEIAAEYALTAQGLEAWKPEARERLKARGMPEEGIEGMMSSRPGNALMKGSADYMLATLEMVRQRYGGVEGYVRDVLGFGDEDVETIRRNLVEEALERTL